MGPYFFERRHIARYARVDAEQCAFTDLREHAIFALRNLLHGNIENQAVVDAIKPVGKWDDKKILQEYEAPVVP